MFFTWPWLWKRLYCLTNLFRLLAPSTWNCLPLFLRVIHCEFHNLPFQGKTNRTIPHSHKFHQTIPIIRQLHWFRIFSFLIACWLSLFLICFHNYNYNLRSLRSFVLAPYIFHLFSLIINASMCILTSTVVFLFCFKNNKVISRFLNRQWQQSLLFRWRVCLFPNVYTHSI